MVNDKVVVGVLEDDPDQAELLRLWLEQAGYQVRWYSDTKDFRRRLGAESIDVLLLDWNLGHDSSGLEMLEWMRESAHQKLPVIFLTARNSEQDIIAGLQAGADDYVAKPFSPRELVARIRVILRRSARAPATAPSPAQPNEVVLRIGVKAS